MYKLVFFFAFPLALGQSPPLPEKGDNGQMGGIFGMGPNGLKAVGGLSMASFPKGSEFPTGAVRNTNGGSGPYKAEYKADPSLPGHTVYAPKVPPPAGVKVPIIVWGNGGCINSGTMFPDFLTEIASYGYLVLANGPPGAALPAKGGSGGAGPPGPLGPLAILGASGMSKVQHLTDSIDWVTKGGAGSKYGEVDTTKLAVAGQSCGGLEAYSASYHDDRVKLTALFNSGIIDDSKTYLLKELKAPVAYFLGGPLDVAYANGERDYPLLPQGLPSMKASLDSGHMGTYDATGGGKFGKAAVAFFEWQFRGDAKAKAKFTDPNSEGSLVKDKWNVTMKNF